MTTENAKNLKQTIDVWHTRKIAKYVSIDQINYDLANDRITSDEAYRLTIFVFKLYEGQ